MAASNSIVVVVVHDHNVIKPTVFIVMFNY